MLVVDLVREERPVRVVVHWVRDILSSVSRPLFGCSCSGNSLLRYVQLGECEG